MENSRVQNINLPNPMFLHLLWHYHNSLRFERKKKKHWRGTTTCNERGYHVLFYGRQHAQHAQGCGMTTTSARFSQNCVRRITNFPFLISQRRCGFTKKEQGRGRCGLTTGPWNCEHCARRVSRNVRSAPSPSEPHAQCSGIGQSCGQSGCCVG